MLAALFFFFLGIHLAFGDVINKKIIEFSVVVFAITEISLAILPFIKSTKPILLKFFKPAISDFLVAVYAGMITVWVIGMLIFDALLMTEMNEAEDYFSTFIILLLFYLSVVSSKLVQTLRTNRDAKKSKSFFIDLSINFGELALFFIVSYYWQ